MYGIYKTKSGILCVGRQTADAAGNPNGKDLPVTNVTPWGASTPQNESAILVYYQASNLFNSEDNVTAYSTLAEPVLFSNDCLIFPNPAQQTINIVLDPQGQPINIYRIIDLLGNTIKQEKFISTNIDVSDLQDGVYYLQLLSKSTHMVNKFVVIR